MRLPWATDEIEQGKHVDPRWLIHLRERGEALTAHTPNPLTKWAELCAPQIRTTVEELKPDLLLGSLFCSALEHAHFRLKRSRSF